MAEYQTTGSVGAGSPQSCAAPFTGPASAHHGCKMLTSCANTSLSPTVLTVAGFRPAQLSPDVRDDAPPSDVRRAPVAPPPRA